MDAYDPISDLKHVLPPERTATLLEGCLRLFDAQTLDEVLQAQALLDLLATTLDSPHDAISFALARVTDFAQRKQQALQDAIRWGQQHDRQACAVEIIPSVWRVRLRLADVDQWLSVRVLHDEHLAYFDYTTEEEELWTTEIEVEEQ